MADQVRLHAGADRRGSPQTAHRSRQPQPQALRQQPGCLQPAALRRAREDRAGHADGNHPPHRLEGARAERFRHCRGSDAQGEPGAPSRHRAVCQRHRRRRSGAEEQPREHRRRHPSEPIQSADRVQRLVLQHGAVHFCRQRLRGPAVRRHRHAGKVLSQVEGGRGRQQPTQARQVPAQDVPQEPADRVDARFRALRRRSEEVCRGRTSISASRRRRRTCAERRAESSGIRKAAARAS